MITRKTCLPALFFLPGLFFCTASVAVALADIELLSSLNQPLRAKVPLLEVTQDELDSMAVSLKVADAAALISTVRGLQYEIKQDEAGHYIEITSENVIREPVVNISLALD